MNQRAFWLLLALLPLAACSTGPNSTSAGASAPPGVASVSSQDQGFADRAASGIAFQIRSSQLAVQKARRPAVRAYAQKMVDDHTAAQQKLVALATQKGIVLPTEPDAAQSRILAGLQGGASGFDAAYMSAQTEAHQNAATLYQAEIATGRDADVKAFAQAGLPQLQTHLAMARRLHGGR